MSGKYTIYFDIERPWTLKLNQVYTQLFSDYVDSIWKTYYIIKFSWNKYYAGTNISSQLQVAPIYTKHWDIYFYIYSIELILNLQDNCLKQN
jgi:hypothetical protein